MFSMKRILVSACALLLVVLPTLTGFRPSTVSGAESEGASASSNLTVSLLQDQATETALATSDKAQVDAASPEATNTEVPTETATDVPADTATEVPPSPTNTDVADTATATNQATPTKTATATKSPTSGAAEATRP